MVQVTLGMLPAPQDQFHGRFTTQRMSLSRTSRWSSLLSGTTLSTKAQMSHLTTSISTPFRLMENKHKTLVRITFQCRNSKLMSADGWDIYRSNNVQITNSYIVNGDDCVSLKPNATNVLIENLYCQGSHGISMGSIGQYAGVQDIIQNVLVKNITMVSTSNGARIKAWGTSTSQEEIPFLDSFWESWDRLCSSSVNLAMPPCSEDLLLEHLAEES